jgi:hypothetical protein
VAQEARRTTRDLFGQAQTELKDQAGAQQKRAADGLRSIGDQLRSMAEKNDRPGMAGDLIGEFSGRVQHAADWLDHREPGQVVAEVRDFARRHPGAFLLGAAVAGVLVGRLTRGVAGDGHGQWQHQQARESSGPPAPDSGAPAASSTAPEMRP